MQVPQIPSVFTYAALLHIGIESICARIVELVIVQSNNLKEGNVYVLKWSKLSAPPHYSKLALQASPHHSGRPFLLEIA